MYRLFSLAALVAVLFAAPVRAAEHDHAEHFTKCAKTCSDCQLVCDTCFKHCLMLTMEGKKEHGKMAMMCADCGECCNTCNTLCARSSMLSAHMLDCCAKCCDDCAASCEKAPDDKHMAECAKQCRDCAKECREMLKHLGAKK
jgi:hypothetical protein